MFLFGHVGLAWGGVLALADVSRRLAASGRRKDRGAPRGTSAEQRPRSSIDYRFVILGSMLPDLIDKPLGIFIFRKELSNGRIFAHGLLFDAAILLAARTWQRRRGRALGSLALGVAAHQALDRMWKDPKALLWPLRGWRPERQDVTNWLDEMMEQLFTDPSTFISEVVGASVVAALIRSLVTMGGLREFTRSGSMSGLPLALRPADLADGKERPQQV